MLTVYFDASGTERDSSCVVIGGYVSTAEKWILFENEWEAILKEYEIDCFHMREFAPSRGRFEKWKGDDEKRKRFLKSLTKVMCAHILHGFVTTILVREFDQINKEYFFEEHFGPPYVACSMMCVRRVCMWAIKNGYENEDIVFVFEDGDIGKGKLYETMNSVTGMSPIFMKKCSVGALQAADFSSWEHHKLRREYEEGITRLRASLQVIRSKIKHDCRLITMETFKNMCKADKVLTRGSFPSILFP
jgi:hypothetical protein